VLGAALPDWVAAMAAVMTKRRQVASRAVRVIRLS
jgi:hypothetical protein